MILLIDNYDSFTYNLAHLFRELGADVAVRRNDEIAPDEAEILSPSHLVVSPGPGRPEEAGTTPEILRRLSVRVPTLGVCLGHQALVQVFGGEVGPARELVHGKATTVTHDGRGIFAGLPHDVRGRALPLARGDNGARRVRGLGHRCRRRGDGRAPPRAPARRRAVPPRVGADAARPRHRSELPREPMIQDALAQLLDGKDLTRDESRRVMDSIMSGDATPAQIGGFLVALRLKGETADEIAGAAEAMRAHVDPGAPASATTSSTPPAPAATAARPSTSRPQRRSSRRRPVPASRSTATGRSRRSPAAPTCSRSSASGSSSSPERIARVDRRARLRLHVRADPPSRDAARRARPHASLQPVPCSTCSGR